LGQLVVVQQHQGVTAGAHVELDHVHAHLQGEAQGTQGVGGRVAGGATVANAQEGLAPGTTGRPEGSGGPGYW